MVYQELICYQDNLAKWAKNNPQIFASIDKQTITQLSKIITWAKGKYPQASVNVFSSGADPWLVAYAAAHHYKLVTLEKSSPKSKTKIKIPDVCNKFGVEYCDTFALLKKEGATFR